MSRDITFAPMLTTIQRGFVIKKPTAELGCAIVGPQGGVSVGPGHLPSVGPVIVVALHTAEGETLTATMGIAGFREFALAMNAAADRVCSGEFNAPPVPQ